jgi:LuxR family maltose regulon positive regulatory protein
MLVVQILLARHDHQATLEVIERLLANVRASGALIFEILLLVMKAQAYHGLGKMDSALSALDHALELAEPEGFVGLFIDNTTPLKDLLTLANKRGIHLDFTQRLLAAYELSAIPSSKENETFSERELEVLRLLAIGLPSGEIATKLVISVNTARTHIKHLFRKLNAHSRYEAIHQAKALKLL